MTRLRFGSVCLLCVALAAARGLADEGRDRVPQDALSGIDVADGLQATLFAAEPMLLSPTNIDVDHRGRVWVCEVVNYRHRAGSRPEGDRILILEDTDGDAVADKSTVFYQGHDVDTAMGICVLGNRVIVSVSPNLFVFTDTDGDDKADTKELLFSQTGTAQHDHSAHAFVFGPDGRLYWNFGNEGHAVHDKDGKPIADPSGAIVKDNGQPYREGMVFRCNRDGSGVEVLGWNFRNNYEVAVDSFGTLWQSDNDDDGNFGVRINYVMEYGNYGYRDEMTGAGWHEPYTGMPAEIPQRHWHLSDPGVVPNLLQTGAGSPTGIVRYEGGLLPEIFRGAIVHCDAGPNVVRAYPVENDKAGYSAKSVNILHGARDQWFRPSDVCVAPDGSLIVADWYDPGVGGHRMGDIDRGRIFRVAPPGAKYRNAKFDFSNTASALEGMQNPNVAVRYMAWTALHQMQAQAEPELVKVWEQSRRPEMRARVLWLLGQIEGRGPHYVERAIADRNPDLRITGIRLARLLKLDVLPIVERLVGDQSPQVRRECAIALRHNSAPAAAALWAELAAQHDGQDRWYLEALGIAADKQWDAFLDAWLEKFGDAWNTPAGRDIVWRSRAAVTPAYLVKIISDPATKLEELPRYLRAFDFLPDDSKQAALAQLAFAEPRPKDPRWMLVAAEAVGRLKATDVAQVPKNRAILNQILDASRGTPQFVTLTSRFSLAERYPELLALAQAKPEEQIAADAARALLAKNQTALFRAALDGGNETAIATARVLGTASEEKIGPLLLSIVEDQTRLIELRRQSVQSLAQTRKGAERVVAMAADGTLDPRLNEAAALALHSVRWREVKERAAKLFPLPPAKNDTPLPPVSELVEKEGDAGRGRVVFNTTGTCAKCHIVNEIGKDVGPNLSEIGNKLSREALFQSILFPSAGISHNYETYVVLQTDGSTVTGVLTSDAADKVSLKDADAIVRTIPRSEIEVMKQQEVSLMPADLQKAMTAEELIDVVEYLTTLKKAQSAGK